MRRDTNAARRDGVEGRSMGNKIVLMIGIDIRLSLNSSGKVRHFERSSIVDCSIPAAGSTYENRPFRAHTSIGRVVGLFVDYYWHYARSATEVTKHLHPIPTSQQLGASLTFHALFPRALNTRDFEPGNLHPGSLGVMMEGCVQITALVPCSVHATAVSG